MLRSPENELSVCSGGKDYGVAPVFWFCQDRVEAKKLRADTELLA